MSKRGWVGVVIIKGSNIIAIQKLKLEDRCSNNQAEQLAIHKALEETAAEQRKHQPTNCHNIY